jgi:hypothetical protein
VIEGDLTEARPLAVTVQHSNDLASACRSCPGERSVLSRPRGMSKNIESPAAAIYRIGHGRCRPVFAGRFPGESGVCFSTGLGVRVDTNRSSKAVRRWCELFRVAPRLRNPRRAVFLQAIHAWSRRVTKQAEARRFPRSHQLSRGSLLSNCLATRSSNQTNRILAKQASFCKKQN